MAWYVAGLGILCRKVDNRILGCWVNFDFFWFSSDPYHMGLKKIEIYPAITFLHMIEMFIFKQGSNEAKKDVYVFLRSDSLTSSLLTLFA